MSRWLSTLRYVFLIERIKRPNNRQMHVTNQNRTFHDINSFVVTSDFEDEMITSTL